MLGGWRGLAKTYRHAGSFQGKVRRFQTISMKRWTAYGSCVHIGANQEGLFLSVFFPFRPGHPPLFIPWRDISTTEVRFLGGKRLELRFRKNRTVPVRINEESGRLLAEAAGENWPAVEPGGSETESRGS